MDSSNKLASMALTMVIMMMAVAVAVAGLGEGRRVLRRDNLALGVNWGNQSWQPLPPGLVVDMLKANNVKRVKLFEVVPSVMKALEGSDIEVMVGIPNENLEAVNDLNQANAWVRDNIAPYMGKNGVNIKYVGVGNEPFLTSYNGTFVDLTLPALQNIQAALDGANYGSQVKATVPLNADVLETSTNLPSGGAFRADIADLMTQIVAFLNQSSAPFTINIYPFISLYNDIHFPADYAFFDGSHTVVDGHRVYRNVLDASYDTLVTAAGKVGYQDLPIIIGEIGWPTDGDVNANIDWAQRFTKGFLSHVASKVGTPLRPGVTFDFYLFSLLDEDKKSIAPGNFERHWGIFQYDGTPKYDLSLSAFGGPSSLIRVKNVPYLPKRWCVVNTNGKDLTNLAESVTNACSNSDCTEIGYGCSCHNYLDANGNASYAFNQYYQIHYQETGYCNFGGLGKVVDDDPSINICKFKIGLSTSSPSSSNVLEPLLYTNLNLLMFPLLNFLGYLFFMSL